MAYLAYCLLEPTAALAEAREDYRLALMLAVPISGLAGFLGIGPGCLLMPTLIIVGFEAKHAAAINTFVVTPPSFSAYRRMWPRRNGLLVSPCRS